MNHITMHGSLTVNGRTVIVHMGDGEANATVDGTHFNVRSLWQLYQLLRGASFESERETGSGASLEVSAKS